MIFCSIHTWFRLTSLGERWNTKHFQFRRLSVHSRAYVFEAISWKLRNWGWAMDVGNRRGWVMRDEIWGKEKYSEAPPKKKDCSFVFVSLKHNLFLFQTFSDSEFFKLWTFNETKKKIFLGNSDLTSHLVLSHEKGCREKQFHVFQLWFVFLWHK